MLDITYLELLTVYIVLRCFSRCWQASVLVRTDSGGIHQQTGRDVVSPLLIFGPFPTAMEQCTLSLTPVDASPRGP